MTDYARLHDDITTDRIFRRGDNDRDTAVAEKAANSSAEPVTS